MQERYYAYYFPKNLSNRLFCSRWWLWCISINCAHCLAFSPPRLRWLNVLEGSAESIWRKRASACWCITLYFCSISRRESSWGCSVDNDLGTLYRFGGSILKNKISFKGKVAGLCEKVALPLIQASSFFRKYSPLETSRWLYNCPIDHSVWPGLLASSSSL